MSWIIGYNTEVGNTLGPWERVATADTEEQAKELLPKLARQHGITKDSGAIMMAWEGGTCPTWGCTVEEPVRRMGFVRSLELPTEKPSRLVNLTPHDLWIVLPAADGDVGICFPSAGLARVSESSEAVGLLHAETGEESSAKFPIVRKVYGEVEGLPSAKEGTVFVVSLVVLQALGGTRSDCFAPDSGPSSAVRDKAGKIVGVRQIMQLS